MIENGIYTMKSEHIQLEGEKKNEDHKIIYTSHHSNHFVSSINLKVSFIIFLFSVKSNSSTPYNSVRNVKGATEDITF